MFGHLVISDMMGQIYWRTSDMRDAFHTAKEIATMCDLLIVRNEETGSTVYLWNGIVSMFVKDGKEWRR